MRISDWSSDVCSSDLLRQWPRASPDRRTGIVATKLPPRLAHLLTSVRSRSCAGHGHRLVRNSENKTLLCHRPTCALAIHLRRAVQDRRSEEHTSELQSLMRISYAVFCLKKKKKPKTHTADKTVKSKT